MALTQTLSMVFNFYLLITVIMIVIFSATFLVLLGKYKKRKAKLHAWAASAFMFLLIQEIITLYWIIDSLTGGVMLYARPWQIQTLAVFFSFTLLGLSMTGKITD